jgi:hypothetical protein
MQTDKSPMDKVIELLKPRYKVIADYPKCPFEIGQVLIQDMSTVGEVFALWSEVGERFISNWIDKDVICKYPHLFQKLEWWQERKIDEMPEYIETGGAVRKFKQLHKDWGIQLYDYPGEIEYEDGVHNDNAYEIFSIEDCLPATLSQYTTFIKNKK